MMKRSRKVVRQQLVRRVARILRISQPAARLILMAAALAVLRS